jgi:hypothetical protein
LLIESDDFCPTGCFSIKNSTKEELLLFKIMVRLWKEWEKKHQYREVVMVCFPLVMSMAAITVSVSEKHEHADERRFPLDFRLH